MQKYFCVVTGCAVAIAFLCLSIFGLPTEWALNWEKTYFHVDGEQVTIYFKGSDSQVKESMPLLAKVIGRPGVRQLRVYVMDAGGDGALLSVSKLPNVVDLIIDTNHITDDGLMALAEMKHLRWLQIYSPQITSRGVSYIGAIKSLVILNISGTAADDDCLDALAQLPHLERLSIRETRITAKGVDRIRPGVFVDR